MLLERQNKYFFAFHRVGKLNYYVFHSAKKVQQVFKLKVRRVKLASKQLHFLCSILAFSKYIQSQMASKPGQVVSSSIAMSALARAWPAAEPSLCLTTGRRATDTPNTPPHPLINNLTWQTEAHQSTYTGPTVGRGQRSMERYRQRRTEGRYERQEEQGQRRRETVVRAPTSKE